jgi:hypothetical protein
LYSLILQMSWLWIGVIVKPNLLIELIQANGSVTVELIAKSQHFRDLSKSKRVIINKSATIAIVTPVRANLVRSYAALDHPQLPNELLRCGRFGLLEKS